MRELIGFVLGMGLLFATLAFITDPIGAAHKTGAFFRAFAERPS